MEPNLLLILNHSRSIADQIGADFVNKVFEVTHLCVEWDAVKRKSVTERQKGKIKPGVMAFGVGHVNVNIGRSSIQLVGDRREVDSRFRPRQTVAGHDELYPSWLCLPPPLLLADKPRHRVFEVRPLRNRVPVLPFITTQHVPGPDVDPDTDVGPFPFPAGRPDPLQEFANGRGDVRKKS